ncbi:hypothetical protein GCM10010433_32560 [Streptomyces pulveraceus]|uniref:Uncharacterized protein n=1 Tax=Streptomyces pulveraceus TaxID=68258 RepID=A0ABW1GVN6_9ACTN
MNLDKVDWGTVPTWMSAIVTTFAFTVAAAVFFRDRHENHRADARSVIAHLADLEDDDFGDVDGQIIFIRNLATRPIFEVSVTFAQVDREGRATGRPGRPPHEVARYIQPDVSRSLNFDRSFLGDDSAACAVFFKDVEGRRWARHIHDSSLIRHTKTRDLFALWRPRRSR